MNSYIPQQYYINTPSPEDPLVKEPGKNKITDNLRNGLNGKNLQKIIKDSALAHEMENSRYTVKTKVAKAFAWATAKASNGKVIVKAIPYTDGSLAAMSFSNGKYNYTKRF